MGMRLAAWERGRGGLCFCADQGVRLTFALRGWLCCSAPVWRQMRDPPEQSWDALQV